jgi:uncharacterized protein (TIGR02466 family)
LIFASAIQRFEIDEPHDAFGDLIASAALQAYRTVLAQSPPAVDQPHLEGGARSLANNEFYRRQREAVERTGEHLPELQNLPAFQKLLAYFREGCREHFCLLGHAEDEAKRRSQGEMYAWCSVHSDGSSHPPHVHSDAVVSGVYYPQTPSAEPGAGQIVFDDPRGKTPFDHLVRIENKLRYGIQTKAEAAAPFNARYAHSPTRGELLLFPPWLVHAVEPGAETEGDERISVCFNLVGSWDDTARLAISLGQEAVAGGSTRRDLLPLTK